MRAPKETKESSTEAMGDLRPARSRRGLWIGVGAAVVVIAILSYGVMSGWFGASTSPPVSLVGAGATFPYPLIEKWSSVYHNLTGVQVNYQAIGSGGGIQQITAKTVDFGASDAPLKPSERAAAPNLLHIPETIGSVTFVYNLPGIGTGLNLTGPVIAAIFLGNIIRWNDANITVLNPGATLPNQAITVVHRSDGSGTTFVWTDYLSKVSPAWAAGPGTGKSVNWPVGIGQQGNSGVAGFIQQSPYAAGYVELAYVLLQSMTVAKIQNQAGNFILPSLESTAAAAAAAAPVLPNGERDWGNVSITDAPGADSYPVASFSYLLVYRELNVIVGMTLSTAQALVAFLWWVVHDGQSYSASLVYVSLPSSVVTINERSIGLITYNGQVLRT